MFLLDTNIWLERLLGQEQSKIVGQLLDNLEPSEIVRPTLAYIPSVLFAID